MSQWKVVAASNIRSYWVCDECDGEKECVRPDYWSEQNELPRCVWCDSDMKYGWTEVRSAIDESLRSWQCCICQKEATGWGNNPAPVSDGLRCCDYCNRTVVIPERLRIAEISMGRGE